MIILLLKHIIVGKKFKNNLKAIFNQRMLCFFFIQFIIVVLVLLGEHFKNIMKSINII